MTKSIIVATYNEGKFKEIISILYDLEVDFLFLKELDKNIEIEEDGINYEQNAYKKAKCVYDIFKCPVIAEDSGLEVDALSGFPGIFSARLNYSILKSFLNSQRINFKVYGEVEDFNLKKEKYSDNEKCDLILKVLGSLKEVKRTAKFICAAVLYLGTKTFFTQSECRGIISESIVGSGGFGYDPIFYIPSLQKTLAQLSMKEKNTISHRAKAFKKLKVVIGQEVLQ